MKLDQMNLSRGREAVRRHSVLEPWLVSIGFVTCFLIGFALLDFDFYRLTLVLAFTCIAIKTPGLQRFLSTWLLVGLLFSAVVAAARFLPSLYLFCLTLPSQQAGPFIFWFVSAAAFLTVLGVGVSQLERLRWPVFWRVAALMAVLLVATISSILGGVALVGLPWA